MHEYGGRNLDVTVKSDNDDISTAAKKKTGDNDARMSRNERITVSVLQHCVDRTKCGLLLL